MSKTLWLIGIGCALFSAACSTSASKSASAKPSPAKKTDTQFTLNSAVGEPLPGFSLKDANGQTVRPADYQGKVVLLDFWATWCGPCKVEIPWFEEFERQYKDQGFAVLGVSMDEDGWNVVRPYVQKMNMNYRVLLGNDEVSTAYGGLDSLPTTLLIDRQGKIASVHVGIPGSDVSAGKEEFKNAIVQLLHAPRQNAAVDSRGVLALLARTIAR